MSNGRTLKNCIKSAVKRQVFKLEISVTWTKTNAWEFFQDCRIIFCEFNIWWHQVQVLYCVLTIIVGNDYHGISINHVLWYFWLYCKGEHFIVLYFLIINCQEFNTSFRLSRRNDSGGGFNSDIINSYQSNVVLVTITDSFIFIHTTCFIDRCNDEWNNDISFPLLIEKHTNIQCRSFRYHSGAI